MSETGRSTRNPGVRAATHPAKLLRAIVSDMGRVSDARMTGMAFGINVLHVAPEAGAGGPLVHRLRARVALPLVSWGRIHIGHRGGASA